ncbi:hypothetical protein, conserved [Leishmania tarentolae]|uniref:Caspase family p20 domain-containing protein n=1 Tax=Leishmania tarentolae TaxID=5689 RepID=A0A640KNR1_LEITA|nr:hypothetical protein, conserved [Leishmania tarentolae]
MGTGVCLRVRAYLGTLSLLPSTISAGSRCFPHLHEGAGLICPRLTLFLRYPLQRLHPCAGLHHGVVQLTADADEGETLLQELTYTVRAEQKQTQDDVVLLGRSDEFICGSLQLWREIHLREHVPAVVQTHGHAEVVLAKEGDIDALHSHDFLQVFDARRCLHLEGNHHVLIRLRHIAQKAFLVHALLRLVHGARARRWIVAAGHGLPQLLRIVHVRDQHTIGATVQSALDASAVLRARHAHHSLGVTRTDGSDHVRHCQRVHRRVLSVDQQPVVAGVTELASQKRAGRVQEDTELRLAGTHVGLEFSAASGHGSREREGGREGGWWWWWWW